MRRDCWLLTLWCAALFAGCFALNTRHHRFPYYYHPDEPGKVEQLLDRDWNLHHPLLLLQATRVAVIVSGTPQSEQALVEVGRRVSAAFIAASVAVLSLLAFQWRGWGAALATGALLAWHHQLYELSHYLKEDSALLFGMALTFLAAWLYGERASLPRAAFLGAACALALSAKYLGAVSLLVALPILWQRSFRAGAAAAAPAVSPDAKNLPRAGRDFLAFAFVLLLVAGMVNWPLFARLAKFRESVARETQFVVQGPAGSTQNVPHSESWSAFLDNSTPVIWLLLLVFLTVTWRRRATLSFAEKLVSAFPFLFAIVLSFSPKSNDRYFLPATAIFSLLSVIGAADLAETLARRVSRRLVFAVAAIALVAAQFPSWSRSRGGWLAYDRAFQRDDTAELIDRLKNEVPPDAVIAKDNRVALPDPQRKKHAARLGIIPQTVVTPRWRGKRSNFAADLGPLEKMRASGITHVAVSEMDYGKFFRGNLRPQNEGDSDFARRRAFYDELFREGELLFEWEKGLVLYLHPGIRVYRLP